MSPELTLISVNIIVIMIAYFLIYPNAAGSDARKITNNDIIASCISLFVAGSIFWGSQQEFNMILFSANWFWFAIVTYLIIEIPFMLWYFNKHNVKF
jgi:hypothetical protein